MIHSKVVSLQATKKVFDLLPLLHEHGYPVPSVVRGPNPRNSAEVRHASLPAC